MNNKRIKELQKITAEPKKQKKQQQNEYTSKLTSVSNLKKRQKYINIPGCNVQL